VHTLAILAQGQGSRLGRWPKGRIPVGDSTTLERLLGLGPFHEILLNAAAEAYSEVTQHRRVPDMVPGLGPMAGIVACMRAASTPWLVAVAVDQPFVDFALLTRLMSTGRPACFTTAGGLEPLPCVVPTAWASRWELELRKGPPLRQVLELSGVTLVPLTPEETNRVASVNTPLDAERLLSLRNFPPLPSES
jgi:molybdopterin-guanine dinucleotide biosynthesis protein A